MFEILNQRGPREFNLTELKKFSISLIKDLSRLKNTGFSLVGVEGAQSLLKLHSIDVTRLCSRILFFNLKRM